MKRDKLLFDDREFDLVTVLIQAYKNKILICSIILTFMFIGYVSTIFQTKKFQIYLTLRNPSPLLFEIYNPYYVNKDFTYSERTAIVSQFSTEFELNLLSIENQIFFFQQNNKIENFKSYLKDKNIRTENYFNEKFSIGPDPKKSINNRYVLTFEMPFPADDFIIDYITFVKKKTELTVKKELLYLVLNEIAVSQNSLKNEKNILSQKLDDLNYKLNKLNNFQLDYNPIADKSVILEYTPKSAKMSVIFFSLLGLFISLIVIIAKVSLIKKKNY